MLGKLGLLGILAIAIVVAASYRHYARKGWHFGMGALAALGSTVSPAQKLPVPPSKIGVNPAYLRSYGSDRQFANLLVLARWNVDPKPPAGFPDTIDPDGNVLRLPEGSRVGRPIQLPDTGPGGKEFVCTYSGEAGSISLVGPAQTLSSAPGKIRFRAVQDWDNKPTIWFSVRRMNPAKPIRDADCREADMPRSLRFAPDFIDDLRGYPVLRFMDWQNTNANVAVTWANRRKPTSSTLGDDGASIEDMMAVANAVGADPWFCMPWNADAEYIEGFAKLVHDLLPRDRSVYVEVGNEVWNWGFPATKQASREGQAEGLSAEPGDARLFRYAERTIEVMRIWERVFADRKGLVRVVSTQNALARQVGQVLRFRDTAAHVDAVATAPYFVGTNDPTTDTADLDETFRQLDLGVDRALGLALDNKAEAAKFGKRYIGYEGGQHITFKTPNLPLMQRIQRDPRMYTLYKKYLQGWKTRVGDNLNLLTTVTSIKPNSGWGQREHAGASLASSPKQRAVNEER